MISSLSSLRAAGAFLLLTALYALPCSAQERTIPAERWRLGGYASGQWIGYTVAIKGLPDIPTCCPEYTGGTGNGFAAGFAAETRLLDLDPRFGVGGRLLLALYSSTLTAEEHKLVTANRDTTTAVFGHTIETSQPALAADLFGTYEVIPHLSLMGGGRVDLMLGGSYYQKEEIISPETIRFENDRRLRLVSDGPVPDENAVHVAAAVGMRYDIALNADRTLLLSPEVQIWQGFSNLITGMDWTMRGVRVGINCSFVKREELAAPITPDPVTPASPSTPATPSTPVDTGSPSSPGSPGQP